MLRFASLLLMLSSCSGENTVSSSSMGWTNVTSESAGKVRSTLDTERMKVVVESGSKAGLLRVQVEHKLTGHNTSWDREFEFGEAGDKIQQLRQIPGYSDGGADRFAFAFIKGSESGSSVHLGVGYLPDEKMEREELELHVIPTPCHEIEETGMWLAIESLEFKGYDTPQLTISKGDETWTYMHDCAVAPVDAWRLLP